MLVRVRKKNKNILPGRYRVIKIGWEAVHELIYETIIDRMEMYLDISDKTKNGGYSFKLDWETGSFVFVVKGGDAENEIPNFSEIDLDALLENMPFTTLSMHYAGRCYREFSLEGLQSIQNRRKQ